MSSKLHAKRGPTRILGVATGGIQQQGRLACKPTLIGDFPKTADHTSRSYIRGRSSDMGPAPLGPRESLRLPDSGDDWWIPRRSKPRLDDRHADTPLALASFLVSSLKFLVSRSATP